MESAMRLRTFAPGDRVIFRRTKFTRHPGPRARAIEATAHGDNYNYFIDKFWIVEQVLEDGTLSLRTRRGKTHVVRADDLNLRHATFWERLKYRARFEPIPVSGSAE
jgi:hypothetical protein